MHSCDHCGTTFTRKSNLNRHKSSNRCKSSLKNVTSSFSSKAIARHNIQTSPISRSGNGEREKLGDRIFSSIERNTIPVVSKQKGRFIVEKDGKVQSLMNEIINDGISKKIG